MQHWWHKHIYRYKRVQLLRYFHGLPLSRFHGFSAFSLQLDKLRIHCGTKSSRFRTFNYSLSHEFGSGLSKQMSAVEKANERSGVYKWSKQCGSSEWVNIASKQVNRRASGTVPTSGFLVVLDHSAARQVTNSSDPFAFSLSQSPKGFSDLETPFSPFTTFCGQFSIFFF